MQRHTRDLLNRLLYCLAYTFGVVPALADDEAAGRVLFNDAMVLLKKGAFEEACPKFEESVRQTYNINAHYFLAECLEKQGKSATAWTTFLSVATKAKAAGDPRREQVARGRAMALESKLVRLRVVVRGEVDGLEIRRNGNLVGKPMWGTAVPVDPGEVEFTATAPDREPFKVTVNASGEGRTVDVKIPALARLAEPEESASTPLVAAHTPATANKRQLHRPVLSASAVTVDSRASAPPRSSGSLGTIGWVTAGVGGLALAGGAFVALVAKNSFDDAKSKFDACVDSACETTYLGKEQSAIRLANVATGLVIGGAVAAGLGVTLVIAQPGASSEAHASLAVRVQPTGISLDGRF